MLRAEGGVTLAAALVLAQTLTLQQAAGEALQRNPALAAAEARRGAAAAREAEARAARLPRVELSESVMRGDNQLFVFGALLEQGKFAFQAPPDVLTNFRVAMTARYAVFDRFRASTGIRQSRNAISRADAELEEARQRLLGETVARFYAVVVAREKLAVASEAARAAEADAKATRDRFEQGLLVESDALSAEVQVASFKQRVIAAEGELAVARAGLGILLQRTVDEEIVPPLERQAETPALHDDARRAALAIARSAVADAELRLASERHTRLPRVDAFGTVGASGATFADRHADHTAGVAVSLDLFDRGRGARIAAARAEIDAAKAAEQQARDAVTMEVTTAWHRLRTARESAEVASTAVRQAEAAARIVRDRYEQGLTTITEQLRAQTALVSARFELVAARYETVVARTELLRAMGDLHEL